MTNYEWLKKYKGKLGRAWKAGLTDRQAAKQVGITEAELVEKIESIKELREYREDKVDDLLIKAQQNIAEAIKDGDVKLSQWYMEKMEHRFGGREITPEEPEDGVDDFLDSFQAKGEFDER